MLGVKTVARRRRKSEQGITIVIVALCMVALLIFVAFAVDIGGAYNQQRQNQSAIDTAVLAGGQELDPNFPALKNCATGLVQPCAATDVKNFVNTTLGTSFGDPTVVNGDWDKCGSTTPPTTFAGVSGVVWNRYPSSANGCIAFSTDGLYLWSQVPANYYKTSFAKAVGFSTIYTSAGAIAGLRAQGMGAVFPFSSSSTAAGEDCLKDASGNSATTCAGLLSPGQFGYMQFAQYGSPTLHTPADCSTTGKAGQRWPSNIAIGVDHDLSTWSVGKDRVEGCGLLDPNETGTESGTTNNILDAGLLTGSPWAGGNCNTCIDDVTTGVTIGNRGKPRLARMWDSTGAYYDRQINISDGGTFPANNTGLWEFMTTSTNDAADNNTPTSCEKTTMDNQAKVSAAAVTGQLQTCFSDYEKGGNSVGCTTSPCTGQLFNRADNTTTSNPHLLDIQLNPRFGYIPIITTACSRPGFNSCVDFVTFRAVYLQQLALDQGKNSVTWDPDQFTTGGDAGDGSGVNGPIRALSSWLFDPNMLSPCPDPSASSCLGSHPVQTTQNPQIQLMR